MSHATAGVSERGPASTREYTSHRQKRHLLRSSGWGCFRSGNSVLSTAWPCGRTPTMDDEYREKVHQLSMEKALAVAAYGESVAAYRYRTLAEKTTSDVHREIFVAMADEEQSHHIQVQECARRHLGSTDFVLTPSDKDLIIVGSRLLDVTDRDSFERALVVIRESEKLTGRFYATLHELTTLEEIRPLLKAMADECQVHAKRLENIPPLD